MKKYEQTTRLNELFLGYAGGVEVNGKKVFVNELLDWKVDNMLLKQQEFGRYKLKEVVLGSKNKKYLEVIMKYDCYTQSEKDEMERFLV